MATNFRLVQNCTRFCILTMFIYVYSLIKPKNVIDFGLSNRISTKINFIVVSCNYFEPKLDSQIVILTSKAFCSHNCSTTNIILLNY